jgi:hypothetical protein
MTLKSRRAVTPRDLDTNDPELLGAIFELVEDDTTVGERLLVDDFRSCHAVENRWIPEEVKWQI